MNTSQLNSNHHRLMADCDTCKNRSRDHHDKVTGNLVMACASLGAILFGRYEISVADNSQFRSSRHIAHELPIAGVTIGLAMGAVCGWAAGTLHESTSKLLSSLSNRKCTCPEPPAKARKRQLPSGNAPLPSPKDMKESARSVLPDENESSDSGDNGQDRRLDSEKETTISFIKDREKFRQNFFRVF